MGIYKIFNGSDKEVEISFNDRVLLSLLRVGDKMPVFSGMLNDMFCFSMGRPWDIASSRTVDITDVRKDGESILIDGNINGVIKCSMKICFDDDGFLRTKVHWKNISMNDLADVVLGIKIEIPKYNKEKITMPHMIYNNNPSADPSRIVPHIDEPEGCGFVCEEHRLPIPCINVEWSSKDNYLFLSLFSIPSALECDPNGEQFWSMGGIRTEKGLALVLLSGALMFNGEKDIVYGFKNKPVPYESGYFDFKPGAEISKEFVLDWGILPQEGRGFRNIISSGYRIYKPQNEAVLTYEKLIALKANAADDRWYDRDGVAGYLKFKTDNTIGKVLNKPMYFLYGWTGQCLKIAWCNAKYGFWNCEEDRIRQCEKAVDFYIDNSGTGIKGLRYTSYMIEEKTWGSSGNNEHPAISSRMLGENMTDIGDIVLLFRDNGRKIPQKWIDGMVDTADFLISDSTFIGRGIYPTVWDSYGKPADEMVTAAGIPCVQALIRIYECTGNRAYLNHAKDLLYKYYEIHAATFEIPFARSTLDARCEDKEAGLYFFLAAYDLYRLTGEAQYKEWAELAADWILTFVYFWNTGFRKGTPCDIKNFTVTGWPGVSVQNHHLDVFFPAYEMWDFGRMTGNSFYEYMGKLVFNAFTNGICTEPGEWNFTVLGEQGEQYYQTNWAPVFEKWRGGFNVWNPSWIIAQVYKAALKFSEEKV